MFQQIEGLYVDKEVSLATLKTVLNKFFDEFFEKDVEVRFRSSYFPFVEPGFEVDVFHAGRWFEVLGAGMVHPHVLTNAGIEVVSDKKESNVSINR
jgi:phenylalanyl-tRNA synthetase alpha chain